MYDTKFKHSCKLYAEDDTVPETSDGKKFKFQEANTGQLDWPEKNEDGFYGESLVGVKVEVRILKS